MELNDEEKVAYEKAAKEFEHLISGKTNFEVKEIYNIRSYAKSRTNLNKAEDELTPDEKAWKTFYKVADELLNNNIDPDKKKEVDELERKSEVTNDFADTAELMIPLGVKIEKSIVKQRAYIMVHGDSEEPSAFRERLNEYEDILFKDKSASKEIKVNAAKAIITLCENYKDTFISDLQSLTAEINHNLAKFNKLAVSLPKDVDYELEKMRQDLIEWNRLTTELSSARTMAVNAVSESITLDTVLPKIIIENGGNTEISLQGEELEDYKTRLATYGSALISARSTDEEISPKRKVITSRLFGDVEAELEQEYADKEVGAQPQTAKQNNSFKSWLKAFCIVLVGIIFVSAGAGILGYVIVVFGIAYGIKLIIKQS